jgi:hypothetical protein
LNPDFGFGLVLGFFGVWKRRETAIIGGIGQIKGQQVRVDGYFAIYVPMRKAQLLVVQPHKRRLRQAGRFAVFDA